MLEIIKTHKKYFIASCILCLLGLVEVYSDFRVFETLILGIPSYLMVLCSKFPSLTYILTGILLLEACLYAKIDAENYAEKVAENDMRRYMDNSCILMLLTTILLISMLMLIFLFSIDVFSVGGVLSQIGQYSQETIKEFSEQTWLKIEVIFWYFILTYSLIPVSILLIFNINAGSFRVVYDEKGEKYD